MMSFSLVFVSVERLASGFTTALYLKQKNKRKRTEKYHQCGSGTNYVLLI